MIFRFSVFLQILSDFINPIKLIRAIRAPRPTIRKMRRFALGRHAETLESRVMLSGTAPVFDVQTYDFSVAEANQLASVGTVNATDAQGDSLSYSVVGGDPNNNFFFMNDGALVVSGLDYETASSHTLTIEVSDGTYTDTATVQVTVIDVVEAPVFSSSSFSFTPTEHNHGMQVVGAVSATDPQGDALTYTILSGDPGGIFSISQTGSLIANGLDYEASSTYSLTIQVSDGNETDTATVQIDVNDVDETPVFDASSYDFTVAESFGGAPSVGTVSATDPMGASLTYSIVSGDPNGLFSIDSSGVITANGLDYEVANSHSLTVEVTNGVETETENVNVTVTDSVYPPLITSLTYQMNSHPSENKWEFSGQASHGEFSGELSIAFGGLLAGESAIVDEFGYFSLIVEMAQGATGAISATISDSSGASSTYESYFQSS